MSGVSIVMTSWNHELVLPRSVLSALHGLRVLREHGLDGEIIVVDDESRDGSPTLLRQLEALYHADGLHVLTMSANVGTIDARNYGLHQARFPYIQQLDSDNELLPENLPCFVQALRETGAASVYGNILQPNNIVSHQSLAPDIFDDNYVDTMALFDRRQLLDVGGYSGIKGLGLEDWELNLHLVSLGRKVVFVPLVIGFYYVLEGSLTNEIAAHEARNRARFRRCFDQIGLRSKMPMNTRNLRYHPAVGYL
jgi:glycosyltransferase involved in cell wall biosynthesis